MKKILMLFISLLFVATVSPIYAAEQPDCEIIYGGGSSCEQNGAINVNIQIKNPDTLVYGENLLQSDPHYFPGKSIPYKVTITNASNATVKNSNVYFYFPQYIEYVSGDGNYDKTKKILRFTIPEMSAKEKKELFVEGKSVSNDKLPNDKNSRCVITAVEVIAANKASDDNSIVCLAKEGETLGSFTQSVQPTSIPTTKPKANANPTQTKGGLPIYQPTQSKSTPDTGPEAAVLPFVTSLLGLGFYLRSKARA